VGKRAAMGKKRAGEGPKLCATMFGGTGEFPGPKVYGGTGGESWAPQLTDAGGEKRCIEGERGLPVGGGQEKKAS